MAIKKFVNPYIAVSLIGVIVAVAGLYLYAQYQHNNTQTPTKVYRELTEAEEAILKENIKTLAQQQKQKAQQKQNKQQSSVDDTSIQDDNYDDLPEYIRTDTVATRTKKDVSDKASFKQEHLQKDNSQLSNVPSFDPKNLPNSLQSFGKGLGNFDTIEINSEEELNKVLAEMKKNGDPRLKPILTMLKTSSNMSGNKRIVVKTVAPRDK